MGLLDFSFLIPLQEFFRTSMRTLIPFAIVIFMTTAASAQTLPVPQAITDPKQIASKSNLEV